MDKGVGAIIYPLYSIPILVLLFVLPNFISEWTLGSRPMTKFVREQ